MAGLATGVAAAVAGLPGLAAGSGVLALTAGLVGFRAAEGRPTPVDPDELTQAKAREQVLLDRIAILEQAARTARGEETPAAGSAPAPTTEKLLIDAETGLFTEAYFAVALEHRIAAARRRLRPVALVLLEAVESGGEDPVEAELVTVALKATLREADTACRLDDGRFALLLEDTPENGAIWTVERVRSHLNEQGRAITVWAGVACYPAHAFDTVEILEQAHLALNQAKEWAQGAIEVAHAD